MLSIYIRNISQLKPISNYDYVVMINATLIASGKVKKHKRADGWAALVKRIAEQHAEVKGSRS